VVDLNEDKFLILGVNIKRNFGISAIQKDNGFIYGSVGDGI